MIKSFTSKLESKCEKLGYLCNNIYNEDGELCISFEPIDDYDRVTVKVESRKINNPSFYIDILDNKLESNEELADYVQVLKNAQNLLNYLNKLDWTKCPIKNRLNLKDFESDTTLIYEGSSQEFKL